MVLVLTTIAVIGAKAITRSGTPLRGGFPSGHSALAFAGWMAITLLVDEQQFLVSSVAFVLALLVARRASSRASTRRSRSSGARSWGSLTALVVIQVFASSDLLGEMRAYYAARAPEYDDWWFRRGRYDLGEAGNARWAAEAAEVEAALDALRPFGSVVELAAGTGLWTRHLVAGATHVLALDASAETLAINRERTGGRAEYRVADLFAWEPEERFDLCVFGFWLSHVPEARFERFWDMVRRASGGLPRRQRRRRPGAPVGERRRAGGAAPGRRPRVRDREAALVAGRPRRAARPARLGGRPAHELGWQLRLRLRQDPGVTGEELVERAESAAQRAYAPYSNYLVGAVVLTRDGTIVEGVNVENAAYPLGVCAERAALSRAVVEGFRPGDIEAVGITASPCGGCRQWLHEFRVDRVAFRREDGSIAEYTSAELLPDTWNLPG